MTEKDFAPLSAACVRALNDKLYEKRKAAAIEIEKMVKDFASVNNVSQIKRLLWVLGQDFALSSNANSKKGGLIGLAAIAIALGKETSQYIDELVQPVMFCLNDMDSRVRYYAAEALYNVVKVARGSVLPFFNDIFDALSKLAADPDQNVKNGSELLDRLMKDVVTESSSFDLVKFIPLLRERMYTKNPFARQFIVSWVSTLNDVPDIDMVIFLPEILDGLFEILDDNTTEIRKMCETVLGSFLRNINKNPQTVDFTAMVSILAKHSGSTANLVQFTALMWLKDFINLARRKLLPFVSSILQAVLPNLGHDDDSKKNIREMAKVVNNSLTTLIIEEDDHDLSTESKEKSGGGELQGNSTNEEKLSDPSGLDSKSLVMVLTNKIEHESMQTRISVLRWILHLLQKIPNKMFKHIEVLFPVLMKTLSDPSDEVVLLDLEVLSEISSSSAGLKQQNQLQNVNVPTPVREMAPSFPSMTCYFTKFMVALMELFSRNRGLLKDRGSFIIRQLCLVLNTEDIYRTIAEILLVHEDLEFACHLVETLNTILLTSTELFELRNQLNNLKTEESCSLFCCLYRSWCHSPVATVSLCLLSQNYKHACDLIHLFGNLEVTVYFLTEVDKLIQLIESPIFTYLRLQLLEPQQNPYLVKSLYGLLMLLPQSEAFHTLRQRLSCIHGLSVFQQPDSKSHSSTTQKNLQKKINFPELLQHFQKTQEKHKQARRGLKFSGK
ncbi:protein VAC14 homolog isoform X1 [Limulus polyphemus]|uniref:Protein VAC14 homolog n=1 Tax=Limulus polyphemus TaxID=6850 RepID=A0ABM1BNE1_LIMPO|nr:protein VAC14 homolog isoform X1 [Limulus polyphemus]